MSSALGLGQSGCSAGAGGGGCPEGKWQGWGSPGCPWRRTGYHGVVRAHGWAADPLVQGQAPGAVGVIGFPSNLGKFSGCENKMVAETVGPQYC